MRAVRMVLVSAAAGVMLAAAAAATITHDGGTVSVAKPAKIASQPR
jgi:hypothetical protein